MIAWLLIAALCVLRLTPAAYAQTGEKSRPFAWDVGRAVLIDLSNSTARSRFADLVHRSLSTTPVVVQPPPPWYGPSCSGRPTTWNGSP